LCHRGWRPEAPPSTDISQSVVALEIDIYSVAAGTVPMTGGRIRGGQTFGSSDGHAECPPSKPVAPADIAKTVFHAMGFDDLSAADRQGRPFNLIDEGHPIMDLF
jgi:hypothetical protein